MNYMEWARYSALSDPQFFLVTEKILNLERDIEKKGGERQTDALYLTRRFEYPWAFLQIPENTQTVLDAGGGPATFQYLLSSFIPKVHNVDLNVEWVNKVNKVKTITGRFSNLTVVRGDILNLSHILDKTFDTTTCISVIEHIEYEKTMKIVDELLRVTRGPVLITADIGENDPELMTPGTLHRLADKHGFTVPDIPLDAMQHRTVRGEPFKVACIKLEGGIL